MKEEIQHIDTTLLAKKVKGLLNEEEEVLFGKWFNHSKLHQEYYQKVALSFQGELEGISKIPEIGNFIEDFDGQNQRRSKRKYFLPIAASIALGICAYLGMQVSVKSTQDKESSPGISVGTVGAIIQKEDGTIIDLTSEESSTVDLLAAVDKKNGVIDYSEGVETTAEKTEINTLIVPTGKEFKLVLSDGTHVWVNSESKLVYQSNFTGTERKIELEGEAYFEVKPDSSRPFIVTTGDQRLTVLGTSFNISAFKDERKVTTTLVEGKVSVVNNITKTDKVDLLPGQQSVFAKGSGKFTYGDVDVEIFTAWREGRFLFRDHPLEEIIRDLSRWYGFDYFFVDPERRKLTFTGEIKRYENFEKVIGIIAKTGEVKIDIKGKAVIIN